MAQWKITSSVHLLLNTYVASNIQNTSVMIQCIFVVVFSVLFGLYYALLCHFLLFSSSCVLFPLCVFPFITSLALSIAQFVLSASVCLVSSFGH